MTMEDIMTIINEMDPYKVERFLAYLDDAVRVEWDRHNHAKDERRFAYKFSAIQTETIRAKFLEIVQNGDNR